MVLQGKARDSEGRHPVATITSAGVKLPQMRILMTGGTVRGGLRHRASGGMAGDTGHLSVRATQGKSRTIMIKHSLFYAPAPGGVTDPAGFTQILFVRTGVTAVTSIKGDLCKSHPPLHLFVALTAGHRTMLPCEGKTGAVMTKPFRVVPVTFGMAGGTCPFPKLPSVGVSVTGSTGGLQPQKGSVQILMGFLQRCRIRDKVGTMTLSAVLDFGMLALQGISRTGMIKGGLPMLPPPDQFRTASLMLHMATRTPAKVWGCVQPFPCLNPCFKKGMAGKALLRIHTAPGRMTACTLLGALQGRMNPVQRARRKLCPGGRREQKKKQNRRREPNTPLHLQPYPVHRATSTCTTMKRYITAAKGL